MAKRPVTKKTVPPKIDEKCSVVLKNNVLELHGSYQGSYIKSSGKNGKETWTNNVYMIRTNKFGEWIIGNSGKRYGDIIQFGHYEKPYDANIKWRYFNGTKYIKADANDIIVNCINDEGKM